MHSFQIKYLARLSALFRDYSVWPSLTAELESQGRVNIAVRRGIVVGVAVVVDNADVSGGLALSRSLPPIAAALERRVNSA